jgi:hypothetical protein
MVVFERRIESFTLVSVHLFRTMLQFNIASSTGLLWKREDLATALVSKSIVWNSDIVTPKFM